MGPHKVIRLLDQSDLEANTYFTGEDQLSLAEYLGCEPKDPADLISGGES